jgi:hypothetical protein
VKVSGGKKQTNMFSNYLKFAWRKQTIRAAMANPVDSLRAE